MTLIISYYYYTQLEQLSVESNEVKGDGSLQSGSCIQGHHIFKNIWNHAVLERLNYDPYKVVILNMYLCLRSMLYCFINLLEICLENQEALTVYISVHCFLASTCTATLCYYAFASVKSAGCQKLVKI